MRVGIVPVEEDALRLVHGNSHFSKTDVSCFDQSDEELGDLVMCYVDDVVIATPTWKTTLIGSMRFLIA